MTSPLSHHLQLNGNKYMPRNIIKYTSPIIFILYIILFFITCTYNEKNILNIVEDQEQNISIRFSHQNTQSSKGPLLTCEVARTQQEQAKGLMFRTSLPPNNCMLFVFQEAKILSFWMKNTSIPLSISFLDDEQKVVSISDLTPFDLTPTSSVFSSLYAIEVNQGWFSKYQISINDKVEISASYLSKD